MSYNDSDQTNTKSKKRQRSCPVRGAPEPSHTKGDAGFARPNVPGTDDVDRRRVVLMRWVTSRWVTTTRRRRNVEKVVGKILARIERLLLDSGIGNSSRGDRNFQDHGKNICFLTATLPRLLGSIELQQTVVRRILTPFRDRVERVGDASFAAELITASRWTQWAPGVASGRWALLVQDRERLDPAEYDPDALDEATYSSCTDELLNYFLLSLVVLGARGPAYWLREGLRLITNRWSEIDLDLPLTTALRTVSEHDHHKHMVYFVLHVVLMANDYGNAPMRSYVLTDHWRQRLFGVLTRWFVNIHAADAAEANMELFFEICYVLLYLNHDRRFALPSALWWYFDTMLQRGMVQDLNTAPLHAKQPRNIYFPAGTTRWNFLSDYHANVIMATFLVEGLRYRSHRSRTGEDMLQTLQRSGMVVLRETDDTYDVTLRNILRKLRDRAQTLRTDFTLTNGPKCHVVL